MTFHTIEVPVPDDDARKILGDKATVVVGESKDSIYWGFGTDCLATLKSAIDGSASKKSEPAKPAQLIIAVTPIVQFMASVEDNPIIRMAATEAAKLTGKDHINMTATMIKNGQTVRFEVESGVIELLGKVAAAAAGGLGGGGAEF